MSQDEVRRGLHRRVLLTRKADPFFTIGFAVCMGAGFGILYRVIVSSTIANHPSHVVTGVLLMVMGIVFLCIGGWRTALPFKNVRHR
jgi:ABC-type uncharacterized transport system permease subunit